MHLCDVKDMNANINIEKTWSYDKLLYKCDKFYIFYNIILNIVGQACSLCSSHLRMDWFHNP